MTALKNLITQMEALRTEFEETALSLVKAEAKNFFDANPDILAVSWSQYAPFFNDGEACEFSVHEIYACGADPDLEEGEEHDFSELHYGEHPGVVNSYNAEVHTAAKAFTDLLASIPEEVMRDVFGDDSRVIITRDGIDIEEIDHD